MTPQEARKILGLGPMDDPRPSFVDLGDARDRMAEMVASAPNKTLADRYRKGLEEFDEALATLRLDLPKAETPSAKPFQGKPSPTPPTPDDDTSLIPVIEVPVITVPEIKIPAIQGSFSDEAEEENAAKVTLSKEATDSKVPVLVEEKVIPPPAPTVVLGKVPAAAAPGATVTTTAVDPELAKPSRGLSYLAWFFVLLVGAAGGAALYVKAEKVKHEQMMVRIAFLERQGSMFIEDRQWQEAANNFTEIESLDPGSEIAARGRRSIEAGMTDEQTQFLGYWNGQAIAELEAGRLDEADAAVHKVLERFPNDKEAGVTRGNIAAARLTQAQDAALAKARDALNQRKFDAAIAAAGEILATAPNDPDAIAIIEGAKTAQAKSTADHLKAAELFRMAAERDHGEFDQQALDWIREASSLAPDDTGIATLLEKLSSYTRTFHVPGDFDTPAEALASARDRDRIVLGAATWKGPLVVDAAVELRGAGSDTTIVECSPEEGSAITIGPDAKGAHVSGISFRHQGFVVGTDRFSTALVRGGTATFADCIFTHASGHGLAIIEAGHGVINHSSFTDNGWNGVAAIGKGSTLEMRESVSLNNFEHGIESWDGAAVILTNNRCEGNSRNGIHTDNGAASADITGNQLIANREFGLVLDSAANGQVSKNLARGNLLGGLVIRAAAKTVTVTGNEATLNTGPGLVLENGLAPNSYSANSLTRNTGEQLLAGANLTIAPDPPPTAEASAAPAPAPKVASPANPPPGYPSASPKPATSKPTAPPRAKIVVEPP